MKIKGECAPNQQARGGSQPLSALPVKGAEGDGGLFTPLPLSPLSLSSGSSSGGTCCSCQRMSPPSTPSPLGGCTLPTRTWDKSTRSRQETAPLPSFPASGQSSHPAAASDQRLPLTALSLSLCA